MEYDLDSKLILTPETEWEEVSAKLAYRLSTRLPEDGVILGKSYDYDVGFYEDVWPALVVFQSDGGNVGQSHDEILMPNIHRFTVRALHPVLMDNPDHDGLKEAQERTRTLLSRWMMALWKNPRLDGEIEMSMTSTITAVQIPGEGFSPDLRGWETAAETKIH